jgi:uracil-DNA glycosylase
MDSLGTFPFGQPVRKIVQADCDPKSVFVLGVYASAVHARWEGANSEEIVKALAVAGEPYIFWRGDGADEIIRQIDIPEPLGRLVPADRRFNGPSGMALDELILQPLGLERSDVWLCDLVPHSCINSGQRKAIERAYLPVAEKYHLPEPSVPPVPKRLTGQKRRAEILSEIQESGADLLILLGDQPTRWFLNSYDGRWRRLADFLQDDSRYGNVHKTQLGDREMQVLPLAHPRQIARLGRSSASWYRMHQEWVVNRAGDQGVH